MWRYKLKRVSPPRSPVPGVSFRRCAWFSDTQHRLDTGKNGTHWGKQLLFKTEKKKTTKNPRLRLPSAGRRGTGPDPLRDPPSLQAHVLHPSLSSPIFLRLPEVGLWRRDEGGVWVRKGDEPVFRLCFALNLKSLLLSCLRQGLSTHLIAFGWLWSSASRPPWSP